MATSISKQIHIELDAKNQSNSSPDLLIDDPNTDIITYIRSLSHIIHELQDSKTL